jgi:myo-inositol-1(or 4)-monophosphatase
VPLEAPVVEGQSDPPIPADASGRAAEAVLRECADIAREILLDGFGKAVVSGVKGRGNVVTETDLAVEKAVSGTIEDAFPDHAILGEERSSTVQSDGWMWVIDPVDGTKNFSRGIPHFCFTLALCFGGEPLLGITLQPITRELFVARRGAGVTLNGQPVSVSDVESIEESVIGIDLGYDNDRGKLQIGLGYDMWPKLESIRVNGSAALGFCYVACGRWDLYLHSNLQPWDSAAGLLLVREAGGIVSDRDGGAATLWSEGTIAGNPSVHDEFVMRYGDRPWRTAETGP